MNTVWFGTLIRFKRQQVTAMYEKKNYLIANVSRDCTQKKSICQLQLIIYLSCILAYSV